MKLILKFLTIVALIALFLSGSLYTTDQWRYLQPYMLLFSMTLILGLNLLYGNLKYKIDFKLLALFSLFILFSLLSPLINSNLELLGGTMLMLYIYISLGIVLPVLIKDNWKDERVLVSTLLIGHIPIILIPMLLEGFKIRSYSEFFIIQIHLVQSLVRCS